MKATLQVSNVELWWPIGYGSQKLYSLTAAFTETGRRAKRGPLSVLEERIVGFRAVELITEPYPNQKGKAMYFRVNGVPHPCLQCIVLRSQLWI